MKKIILSILILIALVFVNGCYYVFNGQFKSMEKLEQGKGLNLYECCSIYSIHTAAWMTSWILCPEAADQCFLMAFSKEGSTHIRKSNFMKSKYIRTLAASNQNKEMFVINYPLNEITSNRESSLRNEMRYALAFDGAKFFRITNPETNTEVGNELRLEVKYDNYTAVYNMGLVKITFNWQLLRYIQDLGWLSKCTIIYRCS